MANPLFAVCPKCGHRPPQPLGATDACPACGVYMHKWPPRRITRPIALRGATDDGNSDEDGDGGDDDAHDWRARWLTLPGRDAGDPAFLLLRAALLCVLAIWGWRLAARDIADGEVFNNFMHSILLPIHEAGHVLFIPFGEFLTIVGGSAFQVLLPLAIGIAFFIRNRDPFGAAVCLWWAGASWVDLAPYIYDALHPQLMLLGGHTGEDGPHDWIYLLDTLGVRYQAHGWGRAAHTAGASLMLLALGWAGWILQQTRKHSRNSPK